MVQVGLVMGSISDWPTLKATALMLERFGISYERRVISAHRMPSELQAYGQTAQTHGLSIIIAGAGGAAHLPGMLAANTVLPVIGVPIQSKALHGIDSLLSIVQMPAGVPVATVAIGTAGAKNAAILAAEILAVTNSNLQTKLNHFHEQQRQEAIASEQQFD